jgi:hypothetical protein
LSAVIVPGAISAAATEQSVNAFDPILSIAMLILFYTIYNVFLLKFVSYYNDSFTTSTTSS